MDNPDASIYCSVQLDNDVVFYRFHHHNLLFRQPALFVHKPINLIQAAVQ